MRRPYRRTPWTPAYAGVKTKRRAQAAIIANPAPASEAQDSGAQGAVQQGGTEDGSFPRNLSSAQAGERESNFRFAS